MTTPGDPQEPAPYGPGDLLGHHLSASEPAPTGGVAPSGAIAPAPGPAGYAGEGGYQYQPFAYPPPPPDLYSSPIADQPRSASRGKAALVALTVAAVVIAGSVVSYVAFKDKNSGAGAATPRDAVNSIVDDLTKSDILGVLDHLPPAERAALRDSFTDEVDQLKRLKVLDPKADPGKVSGIQFNAGDLSFAGSDDVINDHVRVEKITGGTITVNSDASRVPYTKEFLDAAFPHGAPTGSSTNTIDITQEVSRSGEPVRIAVQKVSGEWYPSLMYTIVDAASREAGQRSPTAADAIPALGTGSPDEAVRGLIEAALTSDAESAIGLLSPTEAAAFHDYGKVLSGSSLPSASPYVIDNATFNDTKVSGGVRVSLRTLQLTDLNTHKQLSVSFSDNCVRFASAGDSGGFCATDLYDELGRSATLTPAQKQALTNVFKALPNVGLVTSQSNGLWYVSPIRSLADIGTEVLSGLADNDLITLIGLAASH